MKRPRLQIVRGLPGSGKSTLARERWPHLMLVELDQFCMRGGLYDWTPMVNELAKNWLCVRIQDALLRGIDFVVADVCCGNGMDIRWIVDRALEYGYDVHVKTLYGHHGSVHGVRSEDYEHMRSTMAGDEVLAAEYPTVQFDAMPERFEIEEVPK